MIQNKDPHNKFLSHLRMARAALTLFEKGELPYLEKFIFGSKFKNSKIGTVSVIKENGCASIDVQLNDGMDCNDIEVLKALLGTSTALVFSAIGLDMRFFKQVGENDPHQVIEEKTTQILISNQFSDDFFFFKKNLSKNFVCETLTWKNIMKEGKIMKENEKLEYPKFIWDGAVGARIELSKNKKFLTWSPVRRYKDDQTGEWKYPDNFSSRNKESFAKISEQAFKELEVFDQRAD